MDISVNFNRETPRELSLNFHWNDVTVRSNSQEMLCPFTAQHTSLEQCFRHVFFFDAQNIHFISILLKDLLGTQLRNLTSINIKIKIYSFTVESSYNLTTNFKNLGV